MKLAMTFALALVAGVLLASCGGSAVGDDAGDTLQPDLVCTAQCEGKECGMDGCGGICGGCEGVLVCDAGGHCVEPCVTRCTGKACGDDGCGGTCGACAAGETCTAGTCVAPCSENGFTPEGDDAAYAADAQLLVYAAYQASNPADYLSVELWQR